ncbi:MAG: hypothetical protein WCK63_15325 [Betaproteobacteria bacterium]
MAHDMTRLNASCVLLLLAVSAQAETTMRDPTRPPASMGESTPDATVESGPVLQTVIVPSKGNPVAVISGQQVKLGGMYGDSRLVRLTERGAVLIGPSGTEHLLLTPEVIKTRVGVKENSRTPVAKSAQSGSR